MGILRVACIAFAVVLAACGATEVPLRQLIEEGRNRPIKAHKQYFNEKKVRTQVAASAPNALRLSASSPRGFHRRRG